MKGGDTRPQPEEVIYFAVAYLVIWLTVFITVKTVSKRLNANLT